jgi:hypothetical protein
MATTQKTQTEPVTKSKRATSRSPRNGGAKSSNTYNLASSCTIFEANDIHAAILKQLSDGSLTADISAVAEIDLSVAQVLLAAQKDNPSFKIVGTSEAVTKLAAVGALPL